MRALLILAIFVVSGCATMTKTGTVNVDSYYLTPCDEAAKLPERPVTTAEVLAAHTKTVRALQSCSAKQAGAAKLLKGLSK